jgi:NADPH:quinone reductase-like Zn-dependent oxidoreductase
VPAVLDAVPIGPPAAAVVTDGGTLVTTRPVPPVDPTRGVRQQLVLVELNRPVLRELVADVACGRLQTRVAATFPLADAARAHQALEEGAVRGKIVLLP